MSRTSILTGISLIVVGAIVSFASDSQSITSWIPAFIGAAFLLLGLAALAKPSLNHHLMHAAAAVSLLAILGSLGSLIGRGSTGWAMVAQVATIIIAGAFLFLAIKSFRAARQARTVNAAQ